MCIKRLCYCWAWLCWGNIKLVQFDCAYSCAHHQCVTDITCACLCCTCFSSARGPLSPPPPPLSSVVQYTHWTHLRRFGLDLRHLSAVSANDLAVTRLPSWTMYMFACWSRSFVLPVSHLPLGQTWSPWKYLWLERSVCKEHPPLVLNNRPALLINISSRSNSDTFQHSHHRHCLCDFGRVEYVIRWTQENCYCLIISCL